MLVAERYEMTVVDSRADCDMGANWNTGAWSNPLLSCLCSWQIAQSKSREGSVVEEEPVPSLALAASVVDAVVVL
jgi:hypothetical protein